MTTWNDERGVNLANWRKRNGMTQPGLGARVGVSKSTISAWERNERPPSPEQIEALHAVADELADQARGRLATHENSASGGDAPASDDDAPVCVEGVTVDAVPTWDALVWVDVIDGRRGVSLRAMVDAGLYTRWEDAEAAVDRGAGRWRVIRFTRAPGRVGRPGREILFFDVDEALDFAMSAQTKGSAAVATVLMAHRDELLRITVSDEGAPGPDPYTTTIDWQRWAVEVDGVRGISLRAMVEAGLYTHYRDAVAALRGHGIQSAEISASSARSGPAPSDHLLTLKDAQRLAARAQTPTGRAILDLIIEHHDEFQALLRGDADAHERLADAQSNSAPETPDDPVMAILAAAAETRRAQIAHEQRLAALEHQMARASAQVADVVEVVEDMREQQLADGEVYVGALADQHGWLTEAGNGYTRAVLRSLELAGARGHTRQIRRAAHHEGKAYHDVWVISAQGARLWRDQIRPEWEGLAEDGVVTLPGKMRCFVHLRGAKA